MKTIHIALFSLLCFAFSFTAVAQIKSEKFKVAGECGMCKNKIEKSAKAAGATEAEWNVETKELSVSYANNATSTDKIQQAIAGAGYDTPKFKATDESYSKLHECCKYDRTDTKADCCTAGAEGCCKDGKCTRGGECCKDGKCKNAGGVTSTDSNASCCRKA
jgi:copper chaperone CopZ